MGRSLSVEEALSAVYADLEGFTGWRFLKGQRCLKKKVKDMEFCILFFTSKWNRSYEYIGLNAEFRLIYKKLGKLPVQNTAAYYEYRPRAGEDTYWYDISAEDKLAAVTGILKDEVRNTAMRLAERMEEDREGTVRSLLDEHFGEYHVKLEFAADILGMDAVREQAQKIVEALTDEEKQQIADYRNGKRTKTWMLNPTNLKYIADHDLA